MSDRLPEIPMDAELHRQVRMLTLPVVSYAPRRRTAMERAEPFVAMVTCGSGFGVLAVLLWERCGLPGQVVVMAATTAAVVWMVGRGRR